MLKYLFLVLLLVPLPYACTPTSEQFNYQIKSLDFQHGQVIQNLGRYRLETEDIFDSIPSQMLGIVVFIDEINSSPVTQKIGFYESALADAPPVIIESLIKNISIYATDSLLTSENEYAPLQSLNDEFQLSYFNGSEKFDFHAFIDQFGYWNIVDELLFHSDIILKEPYTGTFKIEITLENEESFLVETDTMKLK